MTYDNVRYRGYVYINPSKIKVMRPGVSEEGLGVDNVYYDNIIHILCIEGKTEFVCERYHEADVQACHTR